MRVRASQWRRSEAARAPERAAAAERSAVHGTPHRRLLWGSRCGGPLKYLGWKTGVQFGLRERRLFRLGGLELWEIRISGAKRSCPGPWQWDI